MESHGKRASVKPNNFVKSALIISIGGLIAKLLGAVYRIPLTNLIGSYGMGLYQLVFPPYILLLTLSTAGIPIAISKLVAEQNQLGNLGKSKQVFTHSLLLLTLFGLFGSLLLFLFAPVIARWQGNDTIAAAYRIIAPSIVFVTVTSAFRGYFQGNMRMMPVSVSQVLEQVAKLVIGLTLATKYMPDVLRAVNGAVIAITVSEFVSLVIVFVSYLAYRRKVERVQVNTQQWDYKKQILSLAFPVVLGGFIMQLTQVIDSVMVVNLLTVGNPTELYGLWTGPVNSLLGLPVTLSAGVAVSALPSITRTFIKGDNKGLLAKFNSAVKLTIVISLPCAFGFIALSRPIISLLYGALPDEEIQITALLLAFSSLSIVFLSLVQTFVATFQALNKPYVPVFILGGAVAVKFLFNLILIPMPSVNIYAAAISESLCYLFAVISDIIYLKKKMNLSVDLNATVLRPLACSMVMLLLLTAMNAFAPSFVSTWLGTFVTIGFAVGGYFAMCALLKVFSGDEIKSIKLFNKGNTNEISRGT